jgi:hypothetical protein
VVDVSDDRYVSDLHKVTFLFGQPQFLFDASGIGFLSANIGPSANRPAAGFGAQNYAFSPAFPNPTGTIGEK